MIEIPLTQGQVALVCDCCYGAVAAFKWRANFCLQYAGGGRYAAARTVYLNGKKRTELMHRVILAYKLGRLFLMPEEEVDHIDGDPLNNRCRNLRLATHSQNMRNLSKYSNNTSGYKGVSWHKQRGRWEAYIKKNGRRKHLGLFDTPEAAAAAYDRAAAELHGEFARLNEIEESK